LANFADDVEAAENQPGHADQEQQVDPVQPPPLQVEERLAPAPTGDHAGTLVAGGNGRNGPARKKRGPCRVATTGTPGSVEDAARFRGKKEPPDEKSIAACGVAFAG